MHVVFKLVYWWYVLNYLFKGSLQIRKSQESDEGKYECVSSNSAGVAYSYAANLYVRGEKVILAVQYIMQ